MTSMMFNVGLLLFLLSTAGEYASASSETFELDKYMAPSLECVRHVACNLNEPLKLKKCVDIMKDQQAEFVLTQVMPKLDKHLQVMKSIEEMRSDDAWLNVYTKVGCALSKEDQIKLLGTLFSEFMHHYMEVCQDVGKSDQCEAINLSNKIYHEMEAEMIARKECAVYGQKLL